jgi:hypothetical protein
MKKNQRDEIGVQGMKQDTRFEKTVMLLFSDLRVFGPLDLLVGTDLERRS